MKKIIFDEEELYVIAVFEPVTRADTITLMEEVLPEVKEDQDMYNLLFSTVEKLKLVTDEVFESLDLDSYRVDPELEDEE
jgi:hypothetical protein